MRVSRLDVIYRKLLLSKFFTKGWGSPEKMHRLFDFRHIISNRHACYKLVPKDYPIDVINIVRKSDCRIIEGKFRSPFALHLPRLVPEEVQDCYFQMVLPLKWKSNYKPICIHLAGTGDHYFWRRRTMMAEPLLKDGIGAIILENPYYGVRKPKDQIRSSVHYVSDIFVMGGCLMLECLVLLNWCERLGFGPLGITGISMGGHGVMSESIDWEMLQIQYETDKLYCDTLSKRCKIVDNPFACDLSRSVPEGALDLPIHLFDDLNVRNITPHQLIHFLNCSTNCRDITYKISSQTKQLLASREFALLNLLKEPPPIGYSKKMREIKRRTKEALWFMRGIMDECTHLKNFSVPFDTSLVISICATADGYVPRSGVSNLEDIWPGVTVKYVDCGHVGAYVWYRKIFREAIISAFELAKKKMEPPSPSLYEI